jgi:hypothetical protein
MQLLIYVRLAILHVLLALITPTIVLLVLQILNCSYKTINVFINVQLELMEIYSSVVVMFVIRYALLVMDLQTHLVYLVILQTPKIFTYNKVVA